MEKEERREDNSGQIGGLKDNSNQSNYRTGLSAKQITIGVIVLSIVVIVGILIL